VALKLVSGRGHYDSIVQAVMAAETSVWIATANLKELMVEDARARPGVARNLRRSSYRSILGVFDELAARQVECASCTRRRRPVRSARRSRSIRAW
jgi:hypothetical protein